jgi:hypothetical protein
MTSTTILILNIVLEAGILGALAFTMSRATKLSPHHQVAQARAAREHRRAAVAPRRRTRLRPLARTSA